MRPEQRDSDLARVRANDVSYSHLRWQASRATDHDVRLLAQTFVEAAKLDTPNTHLQQITLTGNPQVSDASMVALVAALPHSAVSRLDLDGTAVSPALGLVARWIIQPSSTQKPMGGRVGAPHAGNRTASPQCTGKASHGDLRRVHLNDPKLVRLQWGGPRGRLHASDSDVDALAQVLPSNTHLQCIDLRNSTSLSDVGLCALASALPRCGVVLVCLDGTPPWKTCQRWRGATATVRFLKRWLDEHTTQNGLEQATASSSTDEKDISAGGDSMKSRGVSASTTNDDCGRGHDALKLVAAAADGSEAEVKRVLDRIGVYYGCTDSFGRTALWHAAANGHMNVVATLLEGGAEVAIEKCDSQGVTPLLVAAAHGHGPVVVLLVKAGANVRASDRIGRTPLMAASRVVSDMNEPDSRRRADGLTMATATLEAVHRVQRSVVANACHRICKNDPDLVTLDWAGDETMIDDSDVRALANAISAGAAAASIAPATARSRYSALNSAVVTSARGAQIPALRELDLRGSRQITDASLSLLVHALEEVNSGVVRVLVSITGEPNLEDDDQLSEYVTEAMAERLATACLFNTMKLLKASPADVGAPLELDWGRDVAASRRDVYEYGDDALDLLGNTLRELSGGGTSVNRRANVSTLSLRHNQRVSRAGCARLEPVLAAAGVRYLR
jgi:hypothetical protein